MTVLTKQDIYNFVTSLLNGSTVEQSLFDSLLDQAQFFVEGRKQWVALRKTDNSQTISPADTFLTPKDLPSDFKEWYSGGSQFIPVILSDASYTRRVPYFEIPEGMKLMYKDMSQRFYCDYVNNKIYFCGPVSEAYTIFQQYIYQPTLISSGDSQTWVTPFQKFTRILGLLIAVYWKLGVDYDVISNAQANNQAAQAKEMLDIMDAWDLRLQQSMQAGLDPFGALQSNAWQSGQMPIY